MLQLTNKLNSNSGDTLIIDYKEESTCNNYEVFLTVDFEICLCAKFGVWTAHITAVLRSAFSDGQFMFGLVNDVNHELRTGLDGFVVNLPGDNDIFDAEFRLEHGLLHLIDLNILQRFDDLPLKRSRSLGDYKCIHTNSLNVTFIGFIHINLL